MATEKPDILLIVLDTLRRDRLSIYGHQRETSPEFDAFAAEATLFERAIAPAQWTIPAHASLFTGLYPTIHSLTQAYGQLSGSYPTLAEILRAEGYRTVAFCNNPLVGILENGLQRGFDDFFNYAGAAPNRPHHVHRTRVRKAISRRWRRFARQVSNRFAHSDWLFRASLHPLFVPVWTRYINYKGHTQHSIDDLSDYLRRHREGGRATPLFGFLNLMGTHLPYRPPQSYLRKFAPDLDRHAYRFMRRFNADAARWASPTVPPLSEMERDVIARFYDAEIAYQDDQLGRLLRELQRSGALENMMVIIVADHGEGHGDHDFFGHSFVVYQELVHVPLVIRYPPHFPPGQRVATTVSTRRIFHTILEAAGAHPPLDERDPNANVHGLSLARSTNGGGSGEDGLVFAEAFPPQAFLSVIRYRDPPLIDRLRLTHVRRGVYHNGHKLAMVADDVEGLFNINADPAETQDVAAQNRALVDDLQREVNTFVQTAETQRTDSAASGRVSDDVVDNLRALGYIE